MNANQINYYPNQILDEYGFCMCGDCLACRPDLFPIKPNQCVVCGCYNLKEIKKVENKHIHCLDCYKSVVNAKRREQRKQKKDLPKCDCCGKKHGKDECKGVNCGACNDHDYSPLTLLAGVMRCSFCVDDYNNYTCEICGEYEYEEVGLSTGENGVEKRVCGRCDIGCCDYNGWGDKEEEDSEEGSTTNEEDSEEGSTTNEEDSEEGSTTNEEDDDVCPCGNCDVPLDEDMHIFCFSRGDEEMTLCQQCGEDCYDELKDDGWVRDDEEEKKESFEEFYEREKDCRCNAWGCDVCQYRLRKEDYESADCAKCCENFLLDKMEKVDEEKLYCRDCIGMLELANCTDDNRCEDCTWCARTKPCSCGCGYLGGSCDKGLAIDNAEGFSLVDGEICVTRYCIECYQFRELKEFYETERVCQDCVYSSDKEDSEFENLTMQELCEYVRDMDGSDVSEGWTREEILEMIKKMNE